ncbi:MAG: DNA repair protein RecO [Christensenellales bacterium]
MPYLTSQAIVLRHADYREHDRVLTLLTPARGRVEALARGCRKPKSPLLAAGELFCLGEYVLFKGKGHELVTTCQVQDSYYPLREDYDNLSYAALMLSAAEIAAQPEEPADHLMILLTRSLARLAYGGQDAAMVTAAFLLHYASLLGLKPRLNHCAVCQRPLQEGEAAWLDPLAGGLVCSSCRQQDSTAPRLESDSIAWLRQVLTQGIDKTGLPPRQVPLSPLKRYVETLIDRRLPKLPDYIARL